MPKKKRSGKKPADNKEQIEVQQEEKNVQASEPEMVEPQKEERPVQEKQNKKNKTDRKKRKTGLFKRIGSYFRDLKNELKKVVWPTRKRLVRSTIVVLVMVAIICIFVCILDLLFNGAISLLFGKLT